MTGLWGGLPLVDGAGFAAQFGFEMHVAFAQATHAGRREGGGAQVRQVLAGGGVIAMGAGAAAVGQRLLIDRLGVDRGPTDAHDASQ